MIHPFSPAIPLSLFDTESRSTIPVKASDGKTVRMYTCGPTIYNYAHIGNFRTFLFEDLLRRSLKLLGYTVFQVMNLTDVDDKTIKGSIDSQESLYDYTERYAKIFFSDIKTLRIQPAEAYPRATHYIAEMIDMITSLLENNAAYVSSDKSVYYKIAAFQEYGKLSHLEMSSLQKDASERASSDEYEKEKASDFVLWKAFDPERDGNVHWASPWGEGRPGWHIECSVMAKAILGETIDLHAGGVDLIFPHHENEIAQSESCNKCRFSNHWAHSEHLLVDGKKMSKSQGNFYTLKMLLEKGYSAEAIRLFLLGTHYRTQLNFTLEGLQSAESSIRRVRECYSRLQKAQIQKEQVVPSPELLNVLSMHYQKFVLALAKDLNINEALSHFFDLIRQINSAIDLNQISEEVRQHGIELFHTIDSILEILHPTEKSEKIPQEVLDIVDARRLARLEKRWAESDLLREEISKRGYLIEDTAQGQKISPKHLFEIKK
ncbi:MAG: cysteine--tRNA ligase [Chlamydia sp.]